MIFNPLFLSDNTGSQIMAPKQTKMSNNKYLFSDIVKVVMTPIDEQISTNKNLSPLIGSNIGLSLEQDQKPIQLKLKFLSDLDNESAKLGLAEILPIEIAQLLIKDETEANEEKAVSYISKEPLAGDLQNFVNNLIGKEIIESHISEKSGLLLSLEDSKSAVNLELAQVSSEKATSEKIIVQTLVVPEKSKLLSLMGDVQNKKGLFRLDNSQIQNLNNLGESLNTSNGLTGESKPTLSVYSFNYVGENIQSISQNVNSGQELKYNLNLIKSQNSNSIDVQGTKIPTDKVNVAPSDLKNDQNIPVGIMKENNSHLKPLIGDVSLLRNEAANVPKDYSVNKITIVKKQSDFVNAEKLQVNANIPNEKLNSELKRIDFSRPLASKSISINNEAAQNNEKLIDGNKILSKTSSNNYSKVTNDSEQSSSTVVKNDLSLSGKTKTVNESFEKQTSKITQLNKVLENVEANKLNKVEAKQNQTNNSKEPQLENNKLPNSEIKTLQAENIPKNNLADLHKSEDARKNLSTESNLKNGELDTNIKKVNTSSNIDGTIKSDNTDSKATNRPNLVGVEKLNNSTAELNNTKNNVLESENGSKNIEPQKSENNETDKNVLKSEPKDIIKNDLKIKEQSKTVVNEKNNTAEEKQNVAQSDDSKQIQPEANKKISVKVKGGVKSVSEKIDNNVKSTESVRQNETTSEKKDTNKESSSSNEFKNNPFSNNQFNMKVSTESGFKQFLSENEMAAIDNDVKAANLVENESEVKLKVVKSVEVLKEITKFISRNEKGSLSFDIKPEHLGKMKITLETTENIVRARIEVDNEQAKHLIEKNLDKLHQELAENGVELNSLNISMSNSKHHKEEKEMMQNNDSKSENKGQVGETEEEKKKQLGYNTYEYIA